MERLAQRDRCSRRTHNYQFLQQGLPFQFPFSISIINIFNCFVTTTDDGCIRTTIISRQFLPLFTVDSLGIILLLPLLTVGALVLQ